MLPFISEQNYNDNIKAAFKVAGITRLVAELDPVTRKEVKHPLNEIASSHLARRTFDAEADGGLLVQYNAMMSFLKRNLRNVQVEPDFNSLGQLEIPIGALSEICSNALLHRSYSREAPVRLFIFDNRVEIHSPGILPGGLQVEDVLMGTSFPRNKMIFTQGAFLLPYTGVGSGFIRVRELDDKIEVLNDEKRKEVIVTFGRESNQESVRDGVRVTEKSDRGNEESVRPGDRPGVRAKDVLTGKELDIVNYCTVPRTSKEILARVGVSYHSKNLAKYVKSLVNMGFYYPRDAK